MQKVMLEVQKRERTGKEGAKKVRKEGMVPGIIYSPTLHPVPVKMDPTKIREALIKHGANTLFEIKSGDVPEIHGKLAIVKEIQRHPISRKYLHVDLYEVDPGREIYVEVPIEVEGKARGVEKGGMLELLMRNIEIKCTPLNIPDYIKVEVTSLDIGGVLHVEDIEFPEGIKPVEDPKKPVITILAPEKAEEEMEEEAEEKEGETEGE